MSERTIEGPKEGVSQVTEFQPMPEQPQMHDFGSLVSVGAGKVLAFLPPNLVPGYAAVGVEHIERGDYGYLLSPVTIGERRAAREEWAVSIA